MAKNYAIRIDLLKLKGAFMRNLKGQTGTKRCLILPIDDCEGVYLGEKGLYLNMTAIELKHPKYSDTHCLKVDIPKEQREAMTEEERNAIPILGGLHVIEQQNAPAMPVNGTLSQGDFDPMEGDLPF